MRALILDVESAPKDWREVIENGMRPPPYVLAKALELAAKAKTQPKRESAMNDAVKWWYDGALDSKRGSAVSIAWAIHDPKKKEKTRAVSIGPDDRILPERELLEGLGRALEEQTPEVIVAHNGDEFDFPFLLERLLLLELYEPARWFTGIVPYATRRILQAPWPKARLVDTIKAWPSPGYGWDRKRGHGLRALAGSIDATEEDPLELGGSQVMPALIQGRPEFVHAHCRADVDQLLPAWARLAHVLGV